MTETIEIERTLTQRDFNRFAKLSGDHNPIHVDPEFSAQTRFGRTVSHGVLLVSILSGLADKLVPNGEILRQDVMYPAPTYTNTPLFFRAKISSREKKDITISMHVMRKEDSVVTCEFNMTVRIQ